MKAGHDVVYFYVSLRDDLVADVPRDPVEHAGAFAGDPGRDVRRRGRIDPARRPACGRSLRSRPAALLGHAPGDARSATRPTRCCPTPARARRRRWRMPSRSAACSRTKRHIPDALRHYERVRAKRTTALLYQGRRYAGAMRTTNPLLCWARDTAVRLVPRWMVVRSFVMGQKTTRTRTCSQAQTTDYGLQSTVLELRNCSPIGRGCSSAL